MKTGKQIILYVDDEQGLRELFSDQLSELGFEVHLAENGLMAYEKILQNDYAFIITDLDMPEMNGVELIWKIRAVKPYLPVGIASAKITEFANDLVTLAVNATIPKPFRPEHIESAARRLSFSTEFMRRNQIEDLTETVENVMQTDLLYANPDDLTRDAIRGMAENNVGSIVICQGDRLEGLFTERDLLARIALGDLEFLDRPCRESMTPCPKTVKPTDPVSLAEKLVIGERLRYVTVVEDGRLVGLVSAGDLSSSRLLHLKTETARQIQQLCQLEMKKKFS